MAVMKACQANKVKRCVVTSSCVSVLAVDEDKIPEGNLFNETHWSNPDGTKCQAMPYFESKTRAELAAWDFVAKLPDGEKFELATVCPSFVMGPPLKKGETGTSVGFMKGAIMGQLPAVSSEHMQSVDVRDVAKCHVLAMEAPGAAGERYICCQGTPSYQEYVKPVADKFKPLGWPVSDNYVEKEEANIWYFDRSKSEKLGLKYTPWDKTVVDMA